MGVFGNWELPSVFGGSGSVFNDPSQVWGGSDSVFNNTWSAVNSLFNPQGPTVQPPSQPINASAVAGAALTDTLHQEQGQLSASTLLNGGAGLPMSGSPVTASSALRAGSR